MSTKKRCRLVMFCAASLLSWRVSQGAIVYESFNYDVGALNGKTAESGLAAWVVGGATITTPGLTYTDAHDKELPVRGNKAYSSYKAHDAYANILTNGWSSASVDGSRLNRKGATIWWSFLYDWDRRDGWETHRFSLESIDGGYVGLEDIVDDLNTSITFAGMNDDGSKATGGTFTFGPPTLVVMKLETDASGNTQVDMWLDPLLDGGETGLGASAGSITIKADGGDGVLHFDRIHKDQLGHSATFSVDEIRMDASFEAVIDGARPKGMTLIVR